MATTTQNNAERELRALRQTLAHVVNLIELQSELEAKAQRLRGDVEVVEKDITHRKRELERIIQELGVATGVQQLRAAALDITRRTLGGLENASAELGQQIEQLERSTVGEMFFIPISELDVIIGKVRERIQALIDRKVENLFLVSAQDALEEALRYKAGLRYSEAYYYATVGQVFCHVVEKIEELGQQQAGNASTSDPDETVTEDLYRALEVKPNATNEQIRRAYWRLAKRYHPDVQGTGDEQRFKLIQLAYEVLSDPERRQRYDARRTGGKT